MEPAALVGLSDETYELLDVLGEGGFGVVYLARKHPLRKLVALKLLEHRVSAAAERRLWDEALVLASLDHPGIVAVEDLVQFRGQLGLVTEYVEGEDLSVCLAGGLPPSAFLEALGQVAWALHAAGQRGVVHRDVKPQNIRVGRHGNVKLLDFGIAFAEGTEADPAATMVGTARYLAPERFRLEFGPASDVFSLGCILWLGLTGSHFYGDAKTFEETLPLTRSDERWNELLDAWPPTGLAELDDLARSMLARSIEARPTAAEVGHRCEALAERLPERTRLSAWCRDRWPDGVPVPPPRRVERTASSFADRQAPEPSPDDEITDRMEVPRVGPAPVAPVDAADPSAAPHPPERPGWVALAAGIVLGAIGVGGALLGAALYASRPAPVSVAPEFPSPPVEIEAPTASPVPEPTRPPEVPPVAPEPTRPPEVAPVAPEPTRPPEVARVAPAAASATTGPDPVAAPAPAPVRPPPIPTPAEAAAIRAKLGARLGQLEPALQRCGGPSTKGRWRLTFSVQPAGSTSDVAVVALDQPDAALETCVTGQVGAWRFDPVAEAQPVTRTLRFP